MDVATNIITPTTWNNPRDSLQTALIKEITYDIQEAVRTVCNLPVLGLDASAYMPYGNNTISQYLINQWFQLLPEVLNPKEMRTI